MRNNDYIHLVLRSVKHESSLRLVGVYPDFYSAKAAADEQVEFLVDGRADVICIAPDVFAEGGSFATLGGLPKGAIPVYHIQGDEYESEALQWA